MNEWISMDFPTSQNNQDINETTDFAQDYPTPSYVICRVLKAVIFFIGRLWIAYIFVSSLYLVARKLPAMNSTDPDEFENQFYELEILNEEGRLYYGRPIISVPAAFGSILNEPAYFALISLDTLDGCHQTNMKFPSYLKELTLIDSKEWHSHINTSDIPWMAMVPRGGCSFERKVKSLQQSGFSSAVVFNQKYTLEPDSMVRMSASYKTAHEIHIPSMFIKRIDALTMIEALDLLGLHMPIPILAIKVNPLNGKNRFGAGGIKFFISETITFFVDLSVFACGFLTACFALALCRNLIFHQQLLLVNTLLSGSDFLLSSDEIPHQPKLKSIPFEKRIIQESDLFINEEEAKPNNCSKRFSNTCCAVCLDDFVKGDSVRDLPCGHIYHDVCIDPWLLQHNRLCPVCKQDVLKSIENE